MPKPKELTDSPTFHEIWKTAKKAAEALAKSTKKTKDFEAMMDEMTKLKLNFGPELDKWHPLYPDWPKMEAQKAKLELILGKYRKIVTDYLKAIAAKKLVDMPKEIPMKLQKALDQIEEGLNTQAVLAETSIATDPVLGAKLSKEMEKSGGILTPIVVLQHPDIAKLISDRLGDDAKIFAPKKLPVEVILSDTSLLKKMTETPDLRAKVQEAADFGQMLDDITDAFKASLVEIKKAPDKAEAQKPIIQKKIDAAVQAAANRGAEELARITKVRTDYRNYVIKNTVEVTLAVVGILAGIASLGATPFTGGASFIVGTILLAKSAVELGTKLGKLSMDAESFADRLGGRLSTLLKRYEEASSANVGFREMSTTAVNAIFSTTFKSIGECDSDNTQLGLKIDGIENKTGNISSDLNEALVEQDKFLKKLNAWEQENAKVLNPAQIKAIQKLVKALDANAAGVGKLIDSVIKYNASLKKMRMAHKALDAMFKQLSAKEPNWAKFGEVVIKLIVAVGFTVAGTAVVPGPDAFKCVALVKDISDAAGTTLSVLTASKDLYEGAKGLMES